MKVILDTFLREINDKTTVNDQYPVLTSSKAGISLQSDYFNKQVASRDNTGYKIIRQGQFTYRAMSDTGEFFPNMLECTEIGIVSPAYPVFEIAKPDIIIPEFLKYYFKSDLFQHSIASFAQGSTRTSIKFGKLKSVCINLPSVERQARIVGILDKVSRLIQNRSLEIQKLDDLIKARFVEMFGHQSQNEKDFPYMTVDDVAEIYLGITHTPEYVDEGITFISAKNTSRDYLDLTDVKYISREEFDTAPIGSKPKKNDVLFSRVGSNLGHPVILERDMEICTFVSLGFLRTKGNVTSNYLKQWMRDDFFSVQVLEHVKGGGQPNLNTGWLKQFKIIVPDLEKQREFDTFCKQIGKSKSVIQKSLDETQLLFDSLMQQYFG